jgi:signal transduction histidine kinase
VLDLGRFRDSMPKDLCVRADRRYSLSFLGELLLSRRAEILDRWVTRIKWEQAPPGLSRGELWDHLPHILDELRSVFRARDGHQVASPLPEESPAAMRHGTQRLRVGFDIEEVVREYGILAEILLDEVEAAGETLTMSEWRLAVKSINTGIADAVSGYIHRRDEEQQRQAGRHVAFVAHELRNPLMAARTATAALRLTPSDKRLHTILDRNLGRLGELVDEVLTADRLASNVELERESLDLGVVIQETVEDARAAAESRDVTVVVDVEPALPFAGDRRLLRSAVGNLVSNAIKFTRAGGTVHVQGKGDDQFVTVQVDDHCGGLPPGDPAKLFEPFVQRSADRSGLGLGLAIVRQAVDAHGGRIDVKDDPGRGCTFTVVLPASPPSPPPVRHRS